MFRKTSQFAFHETRKQLLLVESELNRAQLLNELRDLNQEIGHLKSDVGAAVNMMSSAAREMTMFFLCRSPL
jgi:hypothetical protein